MQVYVYLTKCFCNNSIKFFLSLLRAALIYLLAIKIVEINIPGKKKTKEIFPPDFIVLLDVFVSLIYYFFLLFHKNTFKNNFIRLKLYI